MRLFIFARHAESAANALQVISSDPSRSFGLTPRGQQQARLLGSQLAHLQIDQAVYTRFRRTQETVELALAGRSVPHRVDADLDEVDAGHFDGAPIGAYWRWKDQHRPSDRFPAGESLDTALHRYTSAVRRLLERSEQTTLVVCHELALRSILEAADAAPQRRPAAAFANAAPQRRPAAAFANAVPYLVGEKALRSALERLDSFSHEDRHAAA
jgi:broad specificity phosphatase PhoE